MAVSGKYKGIILAIVVSLGIAIPSYMFYIRSQNQYNPVLAFSNDGTNYTNITLNEMLQKLTPIQNGVIKLKSTIDGTFSEETYTGFYLADIIEAFNISVGDNNGLRFSAADGWKGPFISLDFLNDTARQHDVFVAYLQDGTELTPYNPDTDSGDGPFIVLCNYSLTDPIPNKPFKGRSVIGINFVSYDNYNLTVYSEITGVLDDKNITIPYGLFRTAGGFFLKKSFDMPMNYTNATTSQVNNYTGILLYRFLNYTCGLPNLDSYGKWSGIRFVAKNGFKSNVISLADINGENTSSNYMIAWEKNGNILNETNGGLLMGIVNYTGGLDYSDLYWTGELTAIELV
ncbi:MAG: hypothetical protein ACTSU2_06505 [Promethearchaeota archaeon]